MIAPQKLVASRHAWSRSRNHCIMLKTSVYRHHSRDSSQQVGLSKALLAIAGGWRGIASKRDHGRCLMNRRLILEQTVECLAGIVRLGSLSGWGLLLYSHADWIEPAFIACILFRDSFGHGLQAFETPRGVEARALLAWVQFKAALRALSHWFREQGQQGAALRAARHVVSPWHLDRARAKGILPNRPIESSFLLFLPAAILIPALPIFPIWHAPPGMKHSLPCRREAQARLNCISTWRVLTSVCCNHLLEVIYVRA